ncbi:MAG: isocitrate lyase/PEP mutase family protein [Desulfovibrio sp.]|jgi:carboxyvinyl-carboxyphosphonate phosphorylmutase|nr:isocitrate lyase/PEP mutase family protein [Desulfovibrio sp.]
MNTAAKFRRLLEQPGIIRAPGAYDAWSAKLIARAGFPAVYMTGYGVSASLLGKPDIGLVSSTEMAAVARNICLAAGDTPVIADADNGYGGALNVQRTVREYEAAGVAAIQLEDQVFPKRCGHMEGKEIIGRGEMAAKIRAAAQARSSADFSLIARTDARAVTGFQDALDRCRAYADAGADILFLEAPQSTEEIYAAAESLGKPLLANMVEKGKTPLLPGKELERMGYKIVIYPGTALFAASRAIADALDSLCAHDTSCYERQVSFPEFNEWICLREERQLEQGFGAASS